MLFSTDTISRSLNSSLPSFKSNSNIDSKSFFIESLELLSEENKIFNSLFMIKTDRSLNESVFKSLIQKIDPKKMFSTILTKFMELLNKLWNSFHSFLLNFLGTNNVIKSYRKKLEVIDEPVEFKEDRFIYTNLGTSTSYTTFNSELNKEYNNLLLSLSKFSSNSMEEIIYTISNMNDEMDMSDDFYSEVRGYIVGSNNSVTKSDFAGELYKYFRNGGNKVGAGLILPGEIKTCVDNYFNYSKMLKQVKKDKSSLESSSKKLQKDIMQIKFENYVKESAPEEVKNMFIKTLQLKSRRVKDLCELYTLVFSAKLDAVKESYSQQAKILICAAKQLAKEGK